MIVLKIESKGRVNRQDLDEMLERAGIGGDCAIEENVVRGRVTVTAANVSEIKVERIEGDEKITEKWDVYKKTV